MKLSFIVVVKEINIETLQESPKDEEYLPPESIAVWIEEPAVSFEGAEVKIEVEDKPAQVDKQLKDTPLVSY